MINTPGFWEKKNPIAFLLAPLSIIYLGCLKIYEIFNKEIDVDIPVICVGNLVAGGSGKTPVTIELRKLLTQKGSKTFVLTRGYKGRLNGPTIVSKKSQYIDVSDEALIHAKHGLTCMAKNKKLGASFCKENGANMIIMDDGLQSKDIKKNFKILVVDNQYGFGNNFVLPAGPMRQTIGQTIKRCDAIIIIKNEDTDIVDKTINHENIFFAKKKIRLKKLNNKNVLVFSGLGNNNNFVEKLQKLKIKIKLIKKFPDHYNYSENEISEIIRTAKEQQLSVVCTEKDYVKIPNKFRKYINVAYLELKIFSSDRLIKLIKQKLIKI